MRVESGRPELDEVMVGVVQEDCAAGLENPLRGGETLYARYLNPGRGFAEAIEADGWAFLADKVGAIVHRHPEQGDTIVYFTNLPELEEEWERIEERHQEDVEAAGEAG